MGDRCFTGFCSICVLTMLLGCGTDPMLDAGVGSVDAGADAGVLVTDGGALDGGGIDAGLVDGSLVDGSAGDAAVADAGELDAGATDAGSSDASAGCEPLDYGAPAVAFSASAADSPVPVGGAVPLGTYDLVRAETFAGSSVPFMRVRGTWVFESATSVRTHEALSSTTVLPVTPSRVWSWSVSAEQLTRVATCSDPTPSTRVHQYSIVPLTDGGVELWIITGRSALIYERR